MGLVEVVAVEDFARARGLAAAGSALVIAGVDADAVGRLVAALRAGGACAAGYVGTPDDPGAEEMARELFPDR